MTFSLIAFSRPGTDDSLRLYSAPIWKVRQLVHEAGLKRHCDSVNAALELELKLTKVSLYNCNETLKEVTISRDTWKYTSEQKDTLATVNNKKHDLQLKDQKTKTRKLTLIAIGQAVIIVLLIL